VNRLFNLSFYGNFTRTTRMEKHVKHMGLLRRMFTEEEWKRLLADHSFTSHLRNALDTLDAVERLAIIGEQIIQFSPVPCDGTSTDPAKHGGPFKTLSVVRTESGIILNEECVACGGGVRRVTILTHPDPAPPAGTANPPRDPA
jgi:hypothetical protein